MKLCEAVVKICSYAKSFDIYNAENFKVCLNFFPHYIIYKEFQLSIFWQIKDI